MRVLIVHNSYQMPGGEDVVFEAEKELLRANGHDVIEFTDSNTRIDQIGKLKTARDAIWSFDAVGKAREMVMRARPDIIHVHNTWMLLSPSIYSVFKQNRIPVVQTLHNYRLLCPNALFYRDKMVCEDCMIYPIPLPGIFHKCYRNSTTQSALVAAMLTFHRARKTWHKEVECYIVLTEFARQKFIQGGLPERKLFVKPNFVSYRFLPATRPSPGTFALFVGRLSQEKGFDMLSNAWSKLPHVPLKIAGDGPLGEQADSFARSHNNIEVLGQVNRDIVFKLMTQARFLVFASSWYEGFPMTIVEAFSSGLPVLAPRLGGIPEIVQEGETGLLFSPGDASDLVEKSRWMWEHPEECAAMGDSARREYEQKYTPTRNYHILMDVYNIALNGTKS